MGNESSYERYYALTATDEDYTGDQYASSPSPYLGCDVTRYHSSLAELSTLKRFKISSISDRKLAIYKGSTEKLFDVWYVKNRHTKGDALRNTYLMIDNNGQTVVAVQECNNFAEIPEDALLAYLRVYRPQNNTDDLTFNIYDSTWYEFIQCKEKNGTLRMKLAHSREDVGSVEQLSGHHGAKGYLLKNLKIHLKVGILCAAVFYDRLRHVLPR
ncbi:hypothetical protein HOLleu_02130 [Holothuria leucospilota]|uniref:Uncharacterized protein n=1 Tax=Holothuria leucospilota TaxID=206669 RepID=A0A9Q1HL92_HOLLE|nr:hypothetical protein HOLleu_02130 [Holothuria leucospilota]